MCVGLRCSDTKNRCVPSEEYLANARLTRLETRRKTAHYACPPTSEACPTAWEGQHHGFACVHTETDVQECGGCLKDGGLNCAQIANAVATSCRQGTCLVRTSFALVLLFFWRTKDLLLVFRRCVQSWFLAVRRSTQLRARLKCDTRAGLKGRRG